MSWAALAWTRPEWLWGLILVPVAIGASIWLARRRRRALDAFAEAEVRERTQALGPARAGLRAGLLVGALAALVVALAGPRWGVERVEAPPVQQRIVFAVDVSRSMLARDVNPSRLERARLAVRQVVAGLPAAEVALVPFAGEATLAVPMTRDVAALDLYLDSVGPDWISDPSTDLANAVRVAVDAFGPGPGSGRAVVLLSDGEDQAGGVDAAVAAARERGVEVETVGLGTPDGARIPLAGGGWLEADGRVVVTRLERKPLETLARGTGGTYLGLASPGADVGPLLARLRSLEAGDEPGVARERKADRYRWPLALAVLLLVAEAALRLSARRRRRFGVAAAAAVAVLGMARAAGPGKLYEEGRYREALLAWRAADRSPGAGPIDAYRRASAAYRMGEAREAAASWAVAARTAETSRRAEEAWYNAGDARYRLAQAAERKDPSAAGRYWDSAVAAYREALLRDPGDVDAKHNLELALRHRNPSGGGGGGAGGGGGGNQDQGGGGGHGVQPPSTGSGNAPREMSRSEAQRLLDALAAREREALARGEGQRRGSPPRTNGW